MGVFTRKDTKTPVPTTDTGDESTQETLTPEAPTPVEAPVVEKTPAPSKKEPAAPIYQTDPALLQRMKDQEETINMLMKVQDVHKMQRLREKDGFVQKDAKVIRIRLFDWQNPKTKEYEEFVIVGWRMIYDRVTAKTAYDHESQMMRITLENGEEVEMTYYNFAVTTDKKVEVSVDKVTEVTNRRGESEKIYSFTYEGRELELAEKFIN